MAASLIEIITAQYVPNAQTTMYTSGAGMVTRIDKLSVTNVSGASATISINLVPSGGTAGASNLTTKLQAILPGDTWNSPTEYGQYLNAGDFISVIASAASALVIAVAGTQQT